MIHEGSLREVGQSLAQELAPNDALLALLMNNVANTAEQIALKILTQEKQ